MLNLEFDRFRYLSLPQKLAFLGENEKKSKNEIKSFSGMRTLLRTPNCGQNVHKSSGNMFLRRLKFSVIEDCSGTF